MTQDEPVMSGSDEASRDEKVRGIVEQLTADMQLRPQEDSEKLLKQRFDDAGIAYDDAEVSRLARDVQQRPSQVD
jgi:hypothetical protein